jgi:hypothetical protein
MEDLPEDAASEMAYAHVPSFLEKGEEEGLH